jgi:hypothetical protein
MSTPEQTTFKVTIPVPRKYASRIIGKNGDNIKKIAMDAGNQTRLLYNDTNETLDIQSSDLSSLKIAAKTIMTTINNIKNNITINNTNNHSIDSSNNKNTITNNQQLVNKINDDEKVEKRSPRYLDVLKTSSCNNIKEVQTAKVKKTVQNYNEQTTTAKKIEIPRATRIIKEIPIHPDITKAQLIYQIIGAKGANIQKICKSIGKNCNILCVNNSHYKIDVANEISFKMAKDMLIKLENQILNNPENEHILAEARGYYIRTYTNGIKLMEPFEENAKLIEMYKKKENIRYQLASNMNKHINEIDDVMINQEYDRRYNKDTSNSNTLMTIEEIQASFKSVPVSPTSTASIRMNMYSKWNDDFGIILMKNELPNTTNTINTISHKLIQNKNKRDRLLLARQQLVEKQIIQISLDSLLDDMEQSIDYDDNDISISPNDYSSIDDDTINDSIIEDDLQDIDFCENHNKMAEYDEYDNYLFNLAKQNNLPMANNIDY